MHGATPVVTVIREAVFPTRCPLVDHLGKDDGPVILSAAKNLALHIVVQFLPLVQFPAILLGRGAYVSVQSRSWPSYRACP